MSCPQRAEEGSRISLPGQNFDCGWVTLPMSSSAHDYRNAESSANVMAGCGVEDTPCFLHVWQERSCW